MKTNYWQKLRLIRHNAWMVVVLWSLWSFIYVGALGTLMNLYLLRLGYEAPFIGLFGGVGWIGFALMGPVAGALGMRWGSRRAMILGTILVAVGFGALTLGGGLPEPWRSAWLLTTYMLGFAGGALIAVNGDPFLMSVSTPEERNHAFGVRQAFSTLAAFTGSMLSGLLPGRIALLLGLTLRSAAPYGYALLAIATLQVLAIWAALASREIPAAHQERGLVSRKSPFPLGPILMVAVFLALWRTGSYIPNGFLNVYLDSRLQVSTELIAILRGIGQIMGIPVGLLMPVLVVRWGKERTMTWMTAGMGLALLPLAMVPHWLAAGFASILFGALSTMSFAILVIVRQQLVEPEWRPVMSGLSILISGLVGGASLLGAGYAIAAWGYQAVFLLCAGVSLLAVLWSWAVFKERLTEPAPAESAQAGPRSQSKAEA